MKVRVNSWHSDPTGWIGAFIMTVFASIAAFRWHSSGLLFFALMFFRDLAAVFFLLTRKKIVSKTRFELDDLVAYVSCAMPFFYFSSEYPINTIALLIVDILSILGFGVATVALFELGSSFGVTPANRGVITTGIYRYLKHPMYAGYILAEVGFIMINHLNVALFAFSVALYLVRGRAETATLQSY